MYKNLFHKVQSTIPGTTIYLVNLELLQDYNDPQHFLTDEEFSTYQKFTHTKRKLQWLGGRISAKKAIMALCSKRTHWHEISINSLESGKPIAHITGSPSSMYISISHSGGWAGAMACDTGHCGIDIQCVVDKISKVSPRFTTDVEISLLEKSLQIGKLERLTLLWAAKESIRKATGKDSLPGFLEITLIQITASENWHELEFTCAGYPQHILSRVQLYQGFGLALTTTG